MWLVGAARGGRQQHDTSSAARAGLVHSRARRKIGWAAAMKSREVCCSGRRAGDASAAQ